MGKGMETISVDDRKMKIKETQEVVENIQEKQKEMQERIKALAQARRVIVESNIDEDAKKIAVELINAERVAISEESDALSKELLQPLKDMDNVKLEADHQIAESEDKLRNLERFNIAGMLTGNIERINQHIQENTDVKKTASAEIQKLLDLSAQLDAI